MKDEPVIKNVRPSKARKGVLRGSFYIDTESLRPEELATYNIRNFPELNRESRGYSPIRSTPTRGFETKTF